MENLKNKIDEANQKTIEILLKGEPLWIGDKQAIDVLPNLKKNMILHAGPPIEWDRMANPMRNAILGAVVFEKLAMNITEAEQMINSGEVEFSPCHNYNAVGGMTGVTSPSMYVHVVKNIKFGNEAYCMPHEGGSFKGLGWGTNDEETINHVRWMQEELSPVMDAAVKLAGGINVKQIIARAMQMGDECHSRCTAGTMLLTRFLAPYIMDLDYPRDVIKRVFEFLKKHDIFFLHVIMAAGRSIVDPAKDIPYSTIVTTFARNGIDFGIKVSALGDKWFTAPSPKIKTSFFSPKWNDEVATHDMGDSSITETIGLGGQITVCSPAQEFFLGGNYESALRKTLDSYKISEGENSDFAIPNLDFRGGPIGVDIRKVVQTRIQPTVHTATAHINGGFIGGGEAYAPILAFDEAMREYAKKYDI
ncbi:MAG: DUF1116 domain-containing protein [Pelolinea sp.]|nr:DUF1116 domain-containing protein [Pelolinea sp.]